jgi:hypothetical protein
LLASSDVFTSYAHGFSDDDRIQVRASIAGDLPTGLSEGSLYYVITSATDTFQLSATSGGASVAMTTDGEVICFKVVPRVVNASDTVQFPIGNVSITLD